LTYGDVLGFDRDILKPQVAIRGSRCLLVKNVQCRNLSAKNLKTAFAMEAFAANRGLVTA